MRVCSFLMFIGCLLGYQIVQAETYYIRTDGGSISECTGLVDAPYPGSGNDQPCGWKHPFIAIPPSGTMNITGGDTLIINSGSYRMGFGAEAGESCSSSWPWDCYMQPVPSGTPGAPTRILGEGWDTETGSKPELYGVERAGTVLNLEGSDYVEVQYLDVTDHASCVDNSNHSDMACNRAAYPYGDWAVAGITAMDSQNVLLKNLDIHGLTTGIYAGGLTDWTVEKVVLRGNGMVGWDGDVGSGSSNSGTQKFSDFTVEWSGCIEQYPDRSIAGCWGQTAGGYGDGFGTAETGGNWVFTDVNFNHNTSDGLDLLYNDGTGVTTITRMYAEGNAGNQLKVSGTTTIENSVLIGNCNYFSGSAEETGNEYVDDCRALGNSVAIVLKEAGNQFSFVNTTITGEGDVLVEFGGDNCDGSENITMRNMIIKGEEQAINPGFPGERASYFYASGSTGNGDGPCGTITPDIQNAIIYNVKESDICPNPHNILCEDPLFKGDTIGPNTDVSLHKDSPAIDQAESDVGDLVFGTLVVPAVDFHSRVRPDDGTIDWGAYEYLDSTEMITCYGDRDKDGYSDGTTVIATGSCPVNYYPAAQLTSISGDCDDSDKDVHPAGREIPDNGIDEDCSGYDSTASIEPPFLLSPKTE